jgi:methionyl-tRNA formyltransferase
MKLVFLGTPQFAVPSLERLIAQNSFEVAAVVTQPDRKRGRGNDLVPSPVKIVAVEHSIPVWQPERIKRDAAVLESLRSLNADAFVVVAYGQLLSQTILDMPRLGCINGHGSILPYYRGAAPIQWSIYDGASETGITTMLMDIGMDTGAMLLTGKTPIGLLDNAHDVAERLATISAELLVETLLKLEQGTIQPIPQEEAIATYARLIQKEDYQLDWRKSAIALHNQVRGFHPNCATTFRDSSLKVMATVPLTQTLLTQLPPELQAMSTEWLPWLELKTTPGEIVGLLKPQGAVISTGDGLLLLRSLQVSGKKAQTGWDFANGMRLQVGESLGS